MIHRDEYNDNSLRWATCERCGMGWIESEYAQEFIPGTDCWSKIGQHDHACPDPFPRETAEMLHAFYTSPGAPPTSLRTKARIKLGLGH